MKFLAHPDGTIAGRYSNHLLTFPIPSDMIVCSSPADISERDLPAGSSAGSFLAAKARAFRTLHPSISPVYYGGEFLSASEVDLSLSSLITRGGAAKTTVIRPGGILMTSVRTVSELFLSRFVMDCEGFVLGSKTGDQSSRYYNFDEATQTFVDPPGLTADIMDSAGASIQYSPILGEEQDLTGGLADFRIRFTNSGARAVFLSGWTLLVQQTLPR